MSPTGVAGGGAPVGPDGETLKASPPSPVSPSNDEEVGVTPTLVALNAEPTYVDANLMIEFRVRNESGDTVAQLAVFAGAVMVDQGASGRTEYTLSEPLPPGESYRWDARGVYGDGFHTMWSSGAEFRTRSGPTRTGDPPPAGDDPGQGDDPGGDVDPSRCAAIGPSEAAGIVGSTSPGPDPHDAGPFRDRVIANIACPEWGKHMRPNGRISEDVLAWNVPGPNGEAYHIFDIVLASTGPDPSPGFNDITDTIEGGSTFVPCFP